MINLVKKRNVLVVFFMVLVLLTSSVSAFAATVGDSLQYADTGWQRIENTNTNFTYNDPSLWATSPYNSAAYSGGDAKFTCTVGESIKFNFTGDKIRVLFYRHGNDGADINIDGVTTHVSSFGTGYSAFTIVYENSALQDKEHSCVITCTAVGTDGYFDFDAIDIDENAQIKAYNGNIATLPNVPTNLSITPGNALVGLSWDAVTGATGYNIKRATTAGGPYTSVASNVTGTAYTDDSVTNGTIYYYVVTAITAAGESANSFEVSTTPVAPETGDVIVDITMTNGNVKEYQMTNTQVNDFINWYDGRAAGTGIGTGKAYYTMNKDYNLGQYQSRNEYLVFDKISSFEVME